MSVNPLKNKKGEIVPNAWEIIIYPQGGKGKQTSKVIRNVNKAQALQMDLAIRRQYSQDIVPHDPKVTDVWGDWIKVYALDHAAGTVQDIQWASIKLLEHFGTWHLSRLNLPLFESYMRARRKDIWRPPIKNPDPERTYAKGKPVGKSRINTELKYMSMFLAWCVGCKYMLPVPFKVPRFKKLPKRKMILPTMNEMDALLAKCHDDARLAVMLYYDAGLRKNEALHLCAENVFLEEGFIQVIGKGDKERSIAIDSVRLEDELKARIKKTPRGLLLINSRTCEAYKDLRKAIEGAAERAGVHKNVYNHLFRHTYTTEALEAGADLPSLQEQLGHADITTLRRYMHPSLKHRVLQVKKLREYRESCSHGDHDNK